MNRSLFLELALLAAACAGCSDSSVAGIGSPGLLRLDVFPTAPEPRSRDVVVTGTVPWPTDASLIEVQGAQVKVQGADANGGTILRVSLAEGAEKFPELVSIKLKTNIDAGKFNKLVFSTDSAREAYVHCVIYGKGVPLFGSTNRARLEPRESRTKAGTVVLEIPAARHLVTDPDELELVFDTVQTPFRLGSIELCQQPIWAWLPAAEDGFAPVTIDTDARNSVGLSTARTLESEVQVAGPSDMRFAVGIPQPLRLRGVKPIFSIEIHGERGPPLVVREALESDPQAAARWHMLRVPLASFAGQKIRASFSFAIGDKKREAICALTRPRVEIAKPAPRTVLLVTSDTHRADSIGAMNSLAAVQTPAIDALAQRGVLFEDCWASTNVTIPSHVAIMTATSPRDTGVLDNYTRLSRAAYTMAEAFQAAGFATYAVVSAPHLADASSGLGQGFDRMSAPTSTNKRRSAESIEQLMTWIDDAKGQDLFLWLHVFDAHTPYEPPKEFEGRYWPADRDAYDPKLPEPEVPEAFRVNLPLGLRDLGLLSARYRGEVSYLDAQLARLFEVPRIRAGVIALTADHGESLGEHGIFWEHAGLYPQSVHVPLILSWPKAPAGTRVQGPVFQLDLAHTLLHLSGVEDAEIPGADLLEALGGSPAPRFTIGSGADRASVTRDGWHLIVSLRPYLATVGATQVPFPKHRVELFDLAKDPACEHDLAREESARARELRLLLCAWLAAGSPRGWDDRGNKSPEMAEHLAQLGYTATSGGMTINRIDPDCSCAECAPFLPQR